MLSCAVLVAFFAAGLMAISADAAEVAHIAPGWEPQNPAIAAMAAPAQVSTLTATSGGEQPVQSPYLESQPKPVEPFPILLNRIVQKYVHEYLSQPGILRSSFGRTRPYLAQMARVMRSYGVPEDMIYLAFAESEFSRRGKGPWQFNKATAERYGLHVNHWVDERRDPILATRAAAEYLADLHDAAGSDWRMAIIGWNRGTTAISRYWAMRGENFNRYMSRLPRGTRCLLGRFMAVAFIAENSAAYGLLKINFDAPPSYHRVPVRGGTTFAVIARHFDTSVRVLRQMNPGILRDRVPPYAHSYEVRVPLLHTASAE